MQTGTQPAYCNLGCLVLTRDVGFYNVRAGPVLLRLLWLHLLLWPLLVLLLLAQRLTQQKQQLQEAKSSQMWHLKLQQQQLPLQKLQLLPLPTMTRQQQLQQAAW